MADNSGNLAKREGYLQENYRYFHLNDTEGTEGNFHFHEFAKVVLLRSGRADYIVEQVTYSLRPGSILLVPHHAIHRAVIDQTVPYDRVILYLDRQYVERSMVTAGRLECFDRADVQGNCLLIPDEKHRREIEDTLAEYEEAMSDTEPGAQAIRDAVMIKLLIRIDRVSRQMEAAEKRVEHAPAGQIRRGTDPGIADMLTYINENLGADLTVDALAARMCLSRYHFMRLFRAGTGITAHAYVRQARLLGAARMIRSGVPSARAAADCGFGDYSTFSRAFREIFGVRPSELK